MPHILLKPSHKGQWCLRWYLLSHAQMLVGAASYAVVLVVKVTKVVHQKTASV